MAPTRTTPPTPESSAAPRANLPTLASSAPLAVVGFSFSNNSQYLQLVLMWNFRNKEVYKFVSAEENECIPRRILGAGVLATHLRGAQLRSAFCALIFKLSHLRGKIQGWGMMGNVSAVWALELAYEQCFVGTNQICSHWIQRAESVSTSPPGPGGGPVSC